MNTIIEELLHHPLTRYATHRIMRVLDPWVYTKKWLPQIIVVQKDYGIQYTLINGKKNGPSIIYASSRIAIIKSEYVNGILHGPYELWKDEKIIEKGEYHKGGRYNMI